MGILSVHKFYFEAARVSVPTQASLAFAQRATCIFFSFAFFFQKNYSYLFFLPFFPCKLALKAKSKEGQPI
jgi:hypothetical protein